MLPDADVVFGALNAEMLCAAKNLRWMQAIEAGMEHVLFPELIKSDVVVTNMARMFAPGPRDTALAMLLSLTRGLQKTYIPQFQKRLGGCTGYAGKWHYTEYPVASYSSGRNRRARSVHLRRDPAGHFP